MIAPRSYVSHFNDWEKKWMKVIMKYNWMVIDKWFNYELLYLDTHYIHKEGEEARDLVDLN